MPKMIPTLNIVVDGVQLIHGEPVDTIDLPAGCVDSMVRLGQLVAEEDYIEVVPEEDITPEESEPMPSEANLWLDVKVSDLGLPNQIVKALKAAGLVDVRSILAYGSEHGSLTAINGIGDASEAEIQAALTKLQSENG